MVGGLRLAFRSLSWGKFAKSACDRSVLCNVTPVSRHSSHAPDRGRTNAICTPVTRGLVWQLREPNHFSTGHGAVRPLRSAEWRSPIWTAGTERNGTGDPGERAPSRLARRRNRPSSRPLGSARRPVARRGRTETHFGHIDALNSAGIMEDASLREEGRKEKKKRKEK